MKKQEILILSLSIFCVLLFVTGAALAYQLYKERKMPADPVYVEPIHNEEDVNQDFDIGLFQEGYSDSRKEGIPNTVISPLSIKIAMAMVTEGAKEDTLIELRDVVELNENSKEYYKDFLDDSLTQKDITLNIANSIWSREELQFKLEFIDILSRYYKSEATSLDFADPSSVKVINNWVKDKTEGKIDKILEKISEWDIMFLVNAIYFNADWKEPFDEEVTQEKDFTLRDGSKVKANLMAIDSGFLYLEDDDVQAVELPYGEESRYVMRVYLPREEKDIDNFVNSLTKEKLSEWKGYFSKREGYLELPKFKTEYSKPLKDILKRLGVHKAFDPILANFDGIFEGSFISEVVHKTYIDVSERGTEAAAVTMIGLNLSAMPEEPKDKFQMIVDRPFFFTIEDTRFGEILFMGSILDPRE